MKWLRPLALALAALAALSWAAPFDEAGPALAPRALDADELDAGAVSRATLRYELDRLVYPLLDRSGVPGLALTLAVHGEVVAAAAYGSADLATARALGLDDPLWLASVSKVLTAIVVLDLAADGALSLDDPLERWLPEVAMPPAPAGWGPITLQHLLTHTAGFDVRSSGTLPGEAANAPLADLVAGGLPPRVRRPGERITYCNLCYGLLGLVIERVTRLPIGEAFERRLFRPLGLTSGTIVRPTTPEYEAATARAHAATRAGIVGLDTPTLDDPTAGQARLSARDVGRVLAALTTDEPPRPLARGVREALFTPAARSHPALPGWTLGMAESTILGHRVVSHGGDLPGAHSLIVVVPSRRLALFVHVNGASDASRPVETEDGLRDVRWAVAERVLALLADDARVPPSAVAAAAPGTAATGAMPTALIAGTYRPDRFPRSTPDKLLSGVALLQMPVRVEADGSIVLRPPAAASAPRRYVRVAEGVYEHERGGERLAVTADEVGRPLLHLSLGAPATLEPVPPLEGWGVVLTSLGAFTLLALGVLVSWPLGTLGRWRRRSPRTEDAPREVRRARWAARGAAASGLSALALTATMAARSFSSVTSDVSLLPFTWAALALTTLFAAMLVVLVLDGVRSRERALTWVFHALMAAATLALVVQAWTWRVTPWG
jgi:CubicO group peptidase (beta-lactamase class C family)